jgi:hypothetical protein
MVMTTSSTTYSVRNIALDNMRNAVRGTEVFVAYLGTWGKEEVFLDLDPDG